MKNLFTSEQYSEYFSMVIDNLLDKNVEICRIVTDNLYAQVKGLID